MFEKKNKGADHPPFSSASIPTPVVPSYTHWTWSEMKHWGGGGGGRGSFVSSAYWKCTVGCFPVWETIYAKLFPISHIYLIWLAASASSFV